MDSASRPSGLRRKTGLVSPCGARQRDSQGPDITSSAMVGLSNVVTTNRLFLVVGR